MCEVLQNSAKSDVGLSLITNYPSSFGFLVHREHEYEIKVNKREMRKYSTFLNRKSKKVFRNVGKGLRFPSVSFERTCNRSFFY